MWQARTLLETLAQHEADKDTSSRAVPAPEPNGPVPLRLADNLPACREFDLTAVTLPIGRTLDEVLRLFHSPWVLDGSLPEGVTLHQSTRDAFSQHLVSVPSDSTPPLLEIFTDGSYDGQLSYWAFAVIAKWPQGCLLLGHARGIVALEGEALFIGAEEHSALNGERTALFWAVSWTFQLPCNSVCFFWSDCLVAKGQCEGSCSASQQATLGRACRAVVLAAEAAGRINSDSFSHVRAHKGHPYNEFVDVLAKHGGHMPSAIPPAFAGLAHWVVSEEIQWLWLLVETIWEPQAWPTFQGGALVDSRRTLPEPGTLHLSAFGPYVGQAASSVERAEPTDICFAPSVVSVNVQTLQEDRDEGILGRVPYIREQLDHLQVCVAGLQETRSRRAETVVSTTHLRHVSPRDASGGHGVELWLSRTVPFAWTGKIPLFFCQEDVRVLHWCPRTLFARIVRGAVRFVVVVLHAPTAADPQRDVWWQDLRRRLHRTSRRERSL